MLGFLLFALATALLVYGLVMTKKNAQPVPAVEGAVEETETEEENGENN